MAPANLRRYPGSEIGISSCAFFKTRSTIEHANVTLHALMPEGQSGEKVAVVGSLWGTSLMKVGWLPKASTRDGISAAQV
ncbi:hypothetical protein NKJ26_31370 [Mesorhizobium sp. M0152]|uniref:hypothetical protein n=1 Tax=Mesorhizobium sp. M0152 TaxID=2956898 RepID=UPI003336F15E